MHMNQGNDAGHRGEDGVWQDGGLLMHFRSPSQWVAIFLAFQSQAWHTDDTNGHAPVVTPSDTDFTVEIIAALVNPVGPAPEHEHVTLLNVTPDAVDLSGWAIADRNKRTVRLEGAIGAGETLQVSLPPDLQLGNAGGLITLLDKQGRKVHGVSYTAEQANRDGWTIAF
jgi:hypothetical protein